jgi:hypothetical protein
VNLSSVMDEVAARLRTIPTIAGRVYAWPPGSLTPPAAFVAYPGPGTYDLSYQRGADRTEGSCLVLLGRPTEQSTRDLLTGYANGSGAESVKAAVDGDGTYASCDSVTVTGWDVDAVSMGGTDYLAVVFALDIIGRGQE